MATATLYVFSPPHQPGLWVGSSGAVAPGGGGSTPPPPPPPGGTGTLFGWSVAEGLSSLPDPALISTAGPMNIVRRYRAGPFADSWATDSSGMKNDFPAGRAVMYSCKPDLALLAANTPAGAAERARLLAFAKSAPDAAIILFDAWHELDVKFRKGIAPFDTMTVSQVNAAKLIFYSIIKDAGKPHQHTNLIITGFAVNGATSGQGEVWWVGGNGIDRVIDMTSFDNYLVSDTPTTGSHEWANPFAFCQGHGCALGVGELGIHGGTGNVTDYSIVPGWLAAQATYLTSHNAGGHTGAAAVCAFNSNNGEALPIPSLTTAIASAWKTISVAHNLSPTDFRL
jgi:hypothetical protein